MVVEGNPEGGLSLMFRPLVYGNYKLVLYSRGREVVCKLDPPTRLVGAG